MTPFTSKPAMNRYFARRRPSPRRERGVVLFIALIVLVAMTLAGLAMFRSVGTGVIIAGNLTFKESATVSADLGLEAGRAWLVGQTAGALINDITASSYYSSWNKEPAPAVPTNPPVLFDPLTHDWDNLSKLVGIDAANNEVRYVLHRMCNNPNDAVGNPTQQCVTVMSAGTGSTKEHGFYGNLPLSSTFQAYYRITTRVRGPKNTISYVQSIIY